MMLSPHEVADTVGDMVAARVVDDREQLTEIIHGLLVGTQRDALNVAVMLAGVLAVDYEPCVVQVVDSGGRRTSAPGHVSAFAAMVAALTVGDVVKARAVFLTHVGGDGMRALKLLVFALDEVMHGSGLCPSAPVREVEVQPWAS